MTTYDDDFDDEEDEGRRPAAFWLAVGLIVLAAALIAVGVLAKRSPKLAARLGTNDTTTTADPYDRVAVDQLIDRIVPAFKPLNLSPEEEPSASQLTQAVGQLDAVATDLQNPAAQPRGVPPDAVNSLVDALRQMSTASTAYIRKKSACPAGISNATCAGLYDAKNQGASKLQEQLENIAQFGTRPAQAVAQMLYG